MQLSISNLAFHKKYEYSAALLEVLRDARVKYIDVAPSRTFSEKETAEEIITYKNYWKQHGFKIAGMQSLLFGNQEAQLFGTTMQKVALAQRLRECFVIAKLLGAGFLVFGSPRNRITYHNKFEDAVQEASEFFKQFLGELPEDLSGITLCIEPNPREYGCNFATTLDEANAVVNAVDHDQFKMVADTGNMHLSESNWKSALRRVINNVAYAHLSETLFNSVSGKIVRHDAMLDYMKLIGYNGFVAIEMGQQEEFAEIANTLKFVRQFTS